MYKKVSLDILKFSSQSSWVNEIITTLFYYTSDLHKYKHVVKTTKKFYDLDNMHIKLPAARKSRPVHVKSIPPGGELSVALKVRLPSGYLQFKA